MIFATEPMLYKKTSYSNTTVHQRFWLYNQSLNKNKILAGNSIAFFFRLSNYTHMPRSTGRSY